MSRQLLSLPTWLENVFYDRKDNHFSIIELTSGVGLCSIAVAASAESFKLNVTVLATDKAKLSLALTIANAAMNGIDPSTQPLLAILDKRLLLYMDTL